MILNTNAGTGTDVVCFAVPRSRPFTITPRSHVPNYHRSGRHRTGTNPSPASRQPDDRAQRRLRLTTATNSSIFAHRSTIPAASSIKSVNAQRIDVDSSSSNIVEKKITSAANVADPSSAFRNNPQASTSHRIRTNDTIRCAPNNSGTERQPITGNSRSRVSRSASSSATSWVRQAYIGRERRPHQRAWASHQQQLGPRQDSDTSNNTVTAEPDLQRLRPRRRHPLNDRDSQYDTGNLIRTKNAAGPLASPTLRQTMRRQRTIEHHWRGRRTPDHNVVSSDNGNGINILSSAYQNDIARQLHQLRQHQISRACRCRLRVVPGRTNNIVRA